MSAGWTNLTVNRCGKPGLCQSHEFWEKFRSAGAEMCSSLRAWIRGTAAVEEEAASGGNAAGFGLIGKVLGRWPDRREKGSWEVENDEREARRGNPQTQVSKTGT